MSFKTVQVALRVRPLVELEKNKGCTNVLEIIPELDQVRIKHMDKAFTYNYVFGPHCRQEEIYEKSVKEIVKNIFNGYNLTVLAYGQTGSGKTYTMGTTYCEQDNDMGIIPKAVSDIFEYANDNFSYDYEITVSFMELYQETVYDLLSDKCRDQCILDIREDPTKGVTIPGLRQVPVCSVKDVLSQLTFGSRSRVTSCTNMNTQSSRSHAIFTLSVKMQDKKSGNEKFAKFHLVDLAGSERPKKTGAVGTTFKEGVNINKGLLVLGNVISALGDEKHQHGHIPYRDSNLTRLLKDSLGGNSITLMVACVSPADYNLEETLSTLRYADRARKIQNKPVVNQDPKAAEINELKRVIQGLKLQIGGQGDCIISSGDVTSLKEENIKLHARTRELTLQLSTTLNVNTGLLEKIMILQNANEALHKRILELKHDYDATMDKIDVSLSNNDYESLKHNLQRLQQMQSQFIEIDTEQKRTENEILDHEESLCNKSDDGKTDVSMTKDQEKYNNKQMELNNELQEITKKLAIKEQLARQIATNTQYMVDYRAMAENEDKILNLQKEKEELLLQLKNAKDLTITKNVSDQARKRVQLLETQIQDLNRKVQDQARLIKLKEKDVAKINQLNSEILQIKQTRVKLIRKMREESERFRTWKIQRERELAKLKQEDRKKQNQIVKMETLYNKQQNVWKRKVEEASALNKRLKESLALRKSVQTKENGKNDKIVDWIKQELDVRMNLVEAETTLTSLIEDRATLQQQLNKLLEKSGDSNKQSRVIENEIEMRSIQIQGLQQKILDADEDNKKSYLYNIQTMSAAKCALKILMEQVTEIKKNEVISKIKVVESQDYITELIDKSASLEKRIKEMESKQSNNLLALQKEQNEKVGVLLRQLRGVEVINGDHELKERCAIQLEKIQEHEQKNVEYEQKLVALELDRKRYQEQIQKIGMAQNESYETPSKDNNEKDNNEYIPKKKHPKQSRSRLEEQENFMDVTFEELEDDLKKDPDWKRTPIGKWLMEKKRHGIQRYTNTSGEDNTNQSLKRTSEGGCMCSKSNCTFRCGCRKTGQNCGTHCKCSVTCTNKETTD